MVASEGGFVGVVELLIEKGANINMSTKVMMLLPFILCTINFCNQRKRTALMSAAKLQLMNVVECLLSNGAKFDIFDEVTHKVLGQYMIR